MSVENLLELWNKGHYARSRKYRRLSKSKWHNPALLPFTYPFSPFERKFGITVEYQQPDGAVKRGINRKGLIDFRQPINGYFVAGGYAFGRTWNKDYLPTTESYLRYKNFIKEAREQEKQEGVQVDENWVPTRAHAFNINVEEFINGKYKPTQVETIMVGPGGDIPFYEDLTPMDQASWEHDYELRKIDDAQEDSKAIGGEYNYDERREAANSKLLDIAVEGLERF